MDRNVITAIPVYFIRTTALVGKSFQEYFGYELLQFHHCYGGEERDLFNLRLLTGMIAVLLDIRRKKLLYRGFN
jgi:hypothetical protein